MDMTDTLDTADTADTLDTAGTLDTADTADTLDMAGTLDTADTAGTQDTADTPTHGPAYAHYSCINEHMRKYTGASVCTLRWLIRVIHCGLPCTLHHFRLPLWTSILVHSETTRFSPETKRFSPETLLSKKLHR